jgi:hypothetical protein
MVGLIYKSLPGVKFHTLILATDQVFFVYDKVLGFQVITHGSGNATTLYHRFEYFHL